MLGKEAALFVPSGTMGNAIAVRLLTERGDEVLVERRSHVVRFELAGMSAISGVMPRMLDGKGGHLTPEQVRGAVAPHAYYKSDVTLVVLENTHNLGGGTVQSVADAARRDRGRARMRLPGPSGRRADLECGDCARRAAFGAGRGRRHGDDVPVQGPVRSGGLARRVDARADRRRRAASASCWAAGCARRACSRRRGWWRSRRWCRGSRRITRTRACSARPSPAGAA